MTTEHEELLARLDAGHTQIDAWTSACYSEASAAIRDLSAKLEAERKAQAELTEQVSRLHTANSREYQRGRDAQMAAWQDADHSWKERAEAAESRLASLFERTREMVEWAKDLLVLLDVEVESLPESEYKIYEKSYDKTIARFQKAIRALAPEESAAPQDGRQSKLATGSNSPPAAPANAVDTTGSEQWPKAWNIGSDGKTRISMDAAVHPTKITPANLIPGLERAAEICKQAITENKLNLAGSLSGFEQTIFRGALKQTEKITSHIQDEIERLSRKE